MVASSVRWGWTELAVLIAERLVSVREVIETHLRRIDIVVGAIDCLALGLMPNVFWRPLDFGMQRQQLLNLKRLMEAA